MVLDDDEEAQVGAGHSVVRVAPPSPPPRPAARHGARLHQRVCSRGAAALVHLPTSRKRRHRHEQVGDVGEGGATGVGAGVATAAMPVARLKTAIACGLPVWDTSTAQRRQTGNISSDDEADDSDSDEWYDTVDMPSSLPAAQVSRHHARPRLPGCRPPRPRLLVPRTLEVDALFLLRRTGDVRTRLAVDDRRGGLTISFGV